MVISGDHTPSNVREGDRAKQRIRTPRCRGIPQPASAVGAGTLDAALSSRAGVRYQEVERVFSDEASAHIHQLIRLGWKQAEIAAAAGVAPSTVSTAKERVELPGAGSCPAEWCVRAAGGTAMVHPGAGGACLGSRLRERLGFPPTGLSRMPLFTGRARPSPQHSGAEGSALEYPTLGRPSNCAPLAGRPANPSCTQSTGAPGNRLHVARSSAVLNGCRGERRGRPHPKGWSRADTEEQPRRPNLLLGRSE